MAKSTKSATTGSMGNAEPISRLKGIFIGSYNKEFTDTDKTPIQGLEVDVNGDISFDHDGKLITAAYSDCVFRHA